MRNAPHVPQRPQSDEKPRNTGRVRKSERGRRYSKKQKVWEYVRRRASFRVGEMMMIFDLEKGYAQWFLWWLKKGGYIVPVENEGRLEDHVYRRVKPMHPVAPSSTMVEPERRRERRAIVEAKKAVRRALERCDPVELRVIEATEGVAYAPMMAAVREMEESGEVALVAMHVTREYVRRDLCPKFASNRKGAKQ